MSKSKAVESGPRATDKTKAAAKESGKHETGKDNSECASLRPNHPARKETRDEHAKLLNDQRISGFNTGTLDHTSFPKHSTADKGVAAKEAQIKGNRPGVNPRKK